MTDGPPHNGGLTLDPATLTGDLFLPVYLSADGRFQAHSRSSMKTVVNWFSLFLLSLSLAASGSLVDLPLDSTVYVNALGQQVIPQSFEWGRIAVKEKNAAKMRHCGMIDSSGRLGRRQATCPNGYTLSCTGSETFPCCPTDSPQCKLSNYRFQSPRATPFTFCFSTLYLQRFFIYVRELLIITLFKGCPNSTVCCGANQVCQGTSTCCSAGQIGCGEACCNNGETCCGTNCCSAGFTCSNGNCLAPVRPSFIIYPN